MILPIVINVQDIQANFSSITPNQVNSILDGIAKRLAASYARQLEIEAQQTLHQTKKIYIQNIRVVDTGRLEGTVMLDYSKNKLVQMIEEGASAFDIKEGLLRSPKAKVSKNGGRYITVPFRMGTPGIVGESDVFNHIMPQGVYDVVKEKPTNIPVSGGGFRSAGLQMAEIPKEYQTPLKRAEIVDNEGQTLFKEYEHKTSLYSGLIKQQDSVTGQNTYNSFRRVSDPLISPEGKPVGSDPDAFIHPGIQHYQLIQKALAKFDQQKEVSLSLDSSLRKFGFIS